MTGGLACFSLGDYEAKPADTSVFGLTLVIISLLGNAFHSTFQEKYLRVYKPASLELVRSVTCLHTGAHRRHRRTEVHLSPRLGAPLRHPVSPRLLQTSTSALALKGPNTATQRLLTLCADFLSLGHCVRSSDPVVDGHRRDASGHRLHDGAPAGAWPVAHAGPARLSGPQPRGGVNAPHERSERANSHVAAQGHDHHLLVPVVFSALHDEVRNGLLASDVLCGDVFALESDVCACGGEVP